MLCFDAAPRQQHTTTAAVYVASSVLCAFAISCPPRGMYSRKIKSNYPMSANFLSRMMPSSFNFPPNSYVYSYNLVPVYLFCLTVTLFCCSLAARARSGVEIRVPRAIRA